MKSPAALKPSALFHPSRILCPVDFSGLSDLALKYAAAGARAFGATLTVFHAQRLELPAYFTRSQVAALTRENRAVLKGIQEFLRERVRQVLGVDAGRIRIQFESEEGHPVDAILAAAEKRRAELIVMGTHGRGGARRLWLGSVAENVTRQAQIPVFVVRQKQHDFIDPSAPHAVPQVQTILCPVNFSADSVAGLQHAVSLARQFKARLITPCILEPGEKRGFPEIRRELLSWLDRFGGQCDAQVLAQRGRAAEAILKLAADTKADLVVLGARRRASVRIWLWGDTTEAVLRQAPAPVLVVPG